MLRAVIADVKVSRHGGLFSLAEPPSNMRIMAIDILIPRIFGLAVRRCISKLGYSEDTFGRAQIMKETIF
jgi:hypothetical protein